MFKTGDRVSEKVSDRNDYPRKGVVLQDMKETDNSVLVQWDRAHSEWAKKDDDIDLISASLLCDEQTAIDEMNRLEAEYQSLCSEIEQKMTSAAAFLEEANEIATARGQELRYMHDATHPLLKAMDNIGWTTSSLNC